MTALSARLANVSGSHHAADLVKRTIACVVVAQMLPPGLVKGGAAMRIRFGTDNTRFSRDLDVARRDDLNGFIEDLQDRLRIGWGGFTGRLLTRPPARPAGVPSAYLMRPYEVKLDYNQRPWMTLPLELGHDEIDDIERVEPRLAADIRVLFADLGLPQPRPVPLLSVEDQVAQKLHACSAPGSERAHDLVDLQLLAAVPAGIDLNRARLLCERLFRSRRLHRWPPVVEPGVGWANLYAEAADGLDLEDLDGALVWCHDLIARIVQASESVARPVRDSAP